jgi:hypothetical protein
MGKGGKFSLGSNLSSLNSLYLDLIEDMHKKEKESRFL